MVRTLFGLLENTRATTVVGVMEDKLRTLTSMAMGTRELDPASRKAVTKLVGLFLSLGFGNLADRMLPRRADARTEDGGEKKPEDSPAGKPLPEPEDGKKNG